MSKTKHVYADEADEDEVCVVVQPTISRMPDSLKRLFPKKEPVVTFNGSQPIYGFFHVDHFWFDARVFQDEKGYWWSINRNVTNKGAGEKPDISHTFEQIQDERHLMQKLNFVPLKEFKIVDDPKKMLKKPEVEVEKTPEELLGLQPQRAAQSPKRKREDEAENEKEKDEDEDKVADEKKPNLKQSFEFNWDEEGGGLNLSGSFDLFRNSSDGLLF